MEIYDHKNNEIKTFTLNNRGMVLIQIRPALTRTVCSTSEIHLITTLILASILSEQFPSDMKISPILNEPFTNCKLIHPITYFIVISEEKRKNGVFMLNQSM